MIAKMNLKKNVQHVVLKVMKQDIVYLVNQDIKELIIQLYILNFWIVLKKMIPLYKKNFFLMKQIKNINHAIKLAKNV